MSAPNAIAARVAPITNPLKVPLRGVFMQKLWPTIQLTDGGPPPLPPWPRVVFEARKNVGLRLRQVGDGLGNLLEIGNAPLRAISY